MKCLLIRISAGSVLLVALFLVFSCSPKAENVNENQNQNANQDPNVDQNQNGGVVTATPPGLPADLYSGSDDDACKVTDLKQKADAVRDRILLKIWEDNELRQMYRPHTNPSIGRVFDYNVKPKKGSKPGDIDHLEVTFTGQINRKDQFDDLIDKLDDFLREGCVHKYSFFTKGGGSTATSGRGFEWTYCDYPNQACEDGRCSGSCG